MNCIEIKDLSKSYGPVTALHRVSFDVERGEVFGLTRNNVNLRQNTITVAQTLTKEGETIVFC